MYLFLHILGGVLQSLIKTNALDERSSEHVSRDEEISSLIPNIQYEISTLYKLCNIMP